MNLQPLYDVKERLEYAAIAGTGLLSEDFRLQRAAENMKPLAAASPVFGKIDASVQKLLAAPAGERAGLLLDTLALVDAVAYTQAKTGASGELEPMDFFGGGDYQQLSRAQLQPLLSALTTTGGGRIDVINSAWENNPGYFTDYRVLPAVVLGLGDSYSEIAELNTEILKKIGPVALPLLRMEFDPAGKKEMGRRVEAIAAIEGNDAVPWLKEILPKAKKDVRTAVISALGDAIITDLGTDPENIQLLLDLAKTERSKNRAAVLEGLAKQNSEEVRAFWKQELHKNGSESAMFLAQTTADWASELVAEEGWAYLEKIFNENQITQEIATKSYEWKLSMQGKSSPKMLDFWRWMDGHWNEPMMKKKVTGRHSSLDEQTENWLLESVCEAGKSPLCDLAVELWEKDQTNPRYVSAALMAGVLTRSPAEVYDTFSPYICTVMPPENERERKKDLHFAAVKALAALNEATHGIVRDTGGYPIIHYNNGAAPENLDKRWLSLLTESVWTSRKNGTAYFALPENNSVITMDTVDVVLAGLADPGDPEACGILVPHFRKRMAETGNFYAYSYMLLRYHGSFVGVLEKCLQNAKGRTVYAHDIWYLFSVAAKTLPTQDLIDGLREIEHSSALGKNETALLRGAIPQIITRLEGGFPFPEWADVWKMR